MYTKLNECAATVRKCVDGLDYCVAEGGRAFLDASNEKKKELRSKLLNAKRYIKSDYGIWKDIECLNYVVGSDILA